MTKSFMKLIVQSPVRTLTQLVFMSAGESGLFLCIPNRLNAPGRFWLSIRSNDLVFRGIGSKWNTRYSVLDLPMGLYWPGVMPSTDFMAYDLPSALSEVSEAKV